MPQATADRTTVQRANSEFSFPVAAATRLFAGTIVCINASNVAVRGSAATGLRAVGVAIEHADNTAGAAGDVRVKVRRGLWQFGNSASTDQITLADCGQQCWIVDDNTVAKTSDTNTRSVAGIVRDVDAAGVWVEF